MFAVSDSWLGLGIVLIIGVIVVGLATCIGKLIIRLFGTRREATENSRRDNVSIKSGFHEAA